MKFVNLDSGREVGDDLLEDDGEEHVCIKGECDGGCSGGCSDDTGYFKVSNLFSELLNDYQKALARENLGISEEFALKWGNIGGNLLNQKDLRNFVLEQIKTAISSSKEEIEQQLGSEIQQITQSLLLKADIESPTLTGVPKAPQPSLTDNSNRIATTNWVLQKIEAASLTKYIQNLKCTPAYIFSDDPPVNVTLTWEYTKDIDKQWLNDELIDTNIRTAVFKNIGDTKTFNVKYELYESQGQDTVIFHKYNPIYYGTTPNKNLCQKTIDKNITLTAAAGEYIYIMMPSELNYDLSVNGFIGGFVQENNQYLNNTTYKVYRSTNSSLGLTTINLIEQ